MEKHPRVSVIIATHNHAHFLTECLNSVKSQTYSDYEVIVVNNGSTDNTEELIRGYDWEKLRYHYQDDTGSVAGPRNTGIKLAIGEYVAFLDSDDLWFEKKLEVVMDSLENNPDIDIVSHDLLKVRVGKDKKILNCGPSAKDMFRHLLICNRLLGSATVVKRSAIIEAGCFDDRKMFVHTEDYEAWLKLAFLRKRFYFINEVLGENRFHATNLSLDFANALEHEKNVIEKHFRNYKSRLPFEKNYLYLRHLSVINSKLGVQYFFRRKYSKSLKYLSKSFILNPFSCSKYLIDVLNRKT